MLDVSDPRAESDLRRRAAWLLAMLVIVAVLFVVLMTVLISGKGHKNSGGGPAALDSYAGTAATRPAQHSSTQAMPSKSVTTSAASSSSPPAHSQLGCPTAQPCVLDGDVGQGIDAVNAYRTAHGQQAVPGEVGGAAQTCALHNGSGCSGGWAETELPKPDGAAAVQKILPFAHLLDPQLRNFEIGWAYDPGAKLYYFAIIRND